MAPIFTSPVEKTINEQLQALEREKRALERARAALKGPGRRSAGSKAGAQQRQRRKSNKPTRADQALEWIEGHPGVTAAEISEAIGVSKPHAYQLVSRLLSEQAVVRENGKYQVQSARGSGAGSATSGS